MNEALIAAITAIFTNEKFDKATKLKKLTQVWNALAEDGSDEDDDDAVMTPEEVMDHILAEEEGSEGTEGTQESMRESLRRRGVDLDELVDQLLEGRSSSRGASHQSPASVDHLVYDPPSKADLANLRPPPSPRDRIAMMELVTESASGDAARAYIEKENASKLVDDLLAKD